MLRKYLSAIAVMVLVTPGVMADTILVPAQQPTIQAAINAAAPSGDTVLVSAGVYVETINMIGKAITVRSVSGPEATIIDANSAGTAVTCAANEGPFTILEGFTIRNGLALTGGGMRNQLSSPTVRNCIFEDNQSTGAGGGAVYNNSGNARFENCIFWNNSAVNGAAMRNDFAQPTVANCTFSDNDASTSGGALFNLQSAPQLVNCIIWNNTPTQFGGTLRNVSYSNVQGGIAGTGNISVAPSFVDAANGDFRLAASSPCVDAGNSQFVAMTVQTDISGEPRAVDDPDKTDTGLPVFGYVVDMGAHERQVICAGESECEVDTNGDLVIDVFDLLNVLEDWGACP